MSAGAAHSCAIALDGTITCWGNNTNGQTYAPAGTFKALALGDEHSCAVATDDTVTCWPQPPEGVRWAHAGS